MKREIIPFTTEEAWLNERKKYLTSSDVPCLFGCGYQSYSELVESKINPSIEYCRLSNERIDWGNALQDAIAKEFARQNGWTIRKKTEFIAIPDLRIGASFDFEINNLIFKDPPEGKYVGDVISELLEIKNVDSFQYKKEWVTDGFEVEATPYIELQVQHQLLVSGLEVAYIAALIGGNRGVLLRREANPKIQQAILRKCAEFWRSL